MPGFIDVSHMSNEDVRRMGHADDYDEEYVPSKPSYPTYTRSTYTNKPRATRQVVSHKADDVWSASCAAFRINGSYVKVAVVDERGLKTNRAIMDELLLDPTKITQEDREQGEAVRRYFKSQTFKILEGRDLSQFMRSAMEIAEKDNIASAYDIAVITSLPATYVNAAKRDGVDSRIKWARGGYIGDVGHKVETKIEIVKRLWSEKYSTWYVTGINEQDQVVFFSFKKQVEIGDTMTIEGKVKSQRETSTQLSHVKVKS
jgi:hypothetical protein